MTRQSHMPSLKERHTCSTGTLRISNRVAQMTVLGQRAAAGMRLLRVSDGSTVAFSTYWDQANSPFQSRCHY